MRKIISIFPDFIKSVLNSYSQVFLSNNLKFALLICIVTFFDVWAGVSGLLAVVFSNIMAYIIGFNRQYIKSGFYGFNSLLVGLGVGVYYQPNPEFFFLLVFISILTLFITLVLEGVIGKYGLPFLSLSFLCGIWLVTLASRQFSSLEISDRGIYMMNDMYNYGGMKLVDVYNWFNVIPLSASAIMYFKSLGAIFFQYHLFAGIILAIGLLFYSRIAFLLSVIGFYSAYLYYHFIGANIQELSYNYIGFNFILTSMALGGIFMISSRFSFLWIILLTPIISILITATDTIFSIFQISIFSLPFNIIVLMFLYVMKFRIFNSTNPEFVTFQHFSPEKNLYIQLNNRERFSSSLFFPVSLPFWGEWVVTQAHNGEFTHKDDWRHAWDFQIVNEENTTHSGNGNNKEDYFCFNKPVLAAADGIVENIEDNIDDNAIGEINIEHNWGNSIIIKHTAGLYTKLCHLKKGSFKVGIGSIVKKGDIIAYSGNSGRSPEPHLHFQIQATPYIGSKTIDYPLDHYIIHKNEVFSLRDFSKPEKDDKVTNIKKTQALTNAFHFIPGQKLIFSIASADNKKIKQNADWEVKVDIYNNTYISCNTTGSKAFFKVSENILYFTYFDGDRKSLLFYFYLAAYKILFGFYNGLTVKDKFSLDTFKFYHFPILRFVQDFIAPFYMFLKAEYSCTYMNKVDSESGDRMILKSKAATKIANSISKELNFEFILNDKGLEKFAVIEKGERTEATII